METSILSGAQLLEFRATRKRVSNRGNPPPDFLKELIEWGRTAPEEIFAPSSAPVEIYTSVKAELGPWQGPLHRRAVMLECMRVLAGFESSWKWSEGVDLSNQHSLEHITGEETGAWQVSFDSLPFGVDLKELARKFCVPLSPKAFIEKMKAEHTFAMEYIARLLRHTVRHNGPVLRKEINPFLSREAVAEFQRFLV